MRPLRGVITYGNRQTRSSFDAATREELKQRGVGYRLLGVTTRDLHRPERFALALGQDLRCITSMWNADFLVMGSGTDFLQRPRLAGLLLAIARRRGVPTFVRWNICETILRNLADRLGHSRFRGAARTLAAEGIQHLAISERTADDVVAAVAVKRPPVIHNSIALPDRYDLKTVPDDPPIVLNVASVQHRKGPDLFIEVAARVLDNYPRVRFVWVGGNATPELEAYVRAQGLEGRVEFVGKAFPPYEWMQRGSVLLLTSRTEAFGRVVAEAMACYRTVCCFEDTGSAEVAGDTGSRSPKFDLDLMAQHVMRVLAKPVEDRVNRQARERYEALFTPTRFADTVAALLHDGVKAPLA